MFVIRCKNIRLFIFVTFYSFGSVKTECNGGSRELWFEIALRIDKLFIFNKFVVQIGFNIWSTRSRVSF